MADFNKVRPLANSDREVFERGIADEDKLEFVSDYNQGVAIVKKRNLFGAIMVGGKEIIKPIYEKLSTFDCGYAKASYSTIVDGVKIVEEHSINMSGQICVQYNDKGIYLPEEFDWGMNFIGNICVVIKDNLYGLIDSNFNIILDCKYTHFYNFVNGYAIFEGIDNPVIINEDGRICYSIENVYNDGYKKVKNYGNSKQYGLLNDKNILVVPIKYESLDRLKCGLLVSRTDNQQYSFINPSNGEIENIIKCNDIYDISSISFAVAINIGDKSKTIFYDKHFSLLETIPFLLDDVIQDENSILFKVNGVNVECSNEGNLYVSSKNSKEWIHRRNGAHSCIDKKQIYLPYLRYAHERLANGYDRITDENNQKGICDDAGNVIISPKYNQIIYACKDLFIAAIPSQEDDNKHLSFGVIDIHDKIQIPFKYGFLLSIVGEVFAFTMDTKYSINDSNVEYTFQHTSLLSNDQSYTTNISYGIVTISGGELTECNIKKICVAGDDKQWLIVGVIRKGRRDTYPNLKYGVLGIDGTILINPCYLSITFDKNMKNFSVSLDKTNQYDSNQYVDENGNFITRDVKGSLILVPSHIAQSCGRFSEEGIAEIIKDSVIGHLNRDYRVVSLLDGQYIEIPEQYDFAQNFIDGYATVEKNGKSGIINSELKEIIPCQYEEIEAISRNYLKYKSSGLWGIMDFQKNIIIQPKYDNITFGMGDKFVVSLASRNKNGTNVQNSPNFGVIDSHDNIVIVHEYNEIKPISYGNHILWIVDKLIGYCQHKKGVFDHNQELVIPIIFDDIVVNNDNIKCNIFEDSNTYSYNKIENNIKYSAKYNYLGQQILSIDKGIDVRVPKEYMIAFYAGMSMLRIMKNEKWGLIHIDGSILVEPQYTYIDKFKGAYAIVGNADEGRLLFLDDKWIMPMQYGLIDTTGKQVLPIENQRIIFWDNGYICVFKDGLYSILTPTLHQIVSGYSLCEKLDNRFIIVNGESNNYYSKKRLIDYSGHEVFDNSQINRDFDEIEIIEDTYFKIVFCRGDFNSNIGIADFAGKIIYDKGECADITYLKNGYFKVEKNIYIDDDRTRRIYNLVNSVGKEIFESYYYNIEVKDSATILIENYDGNGMADMFGNVIIPPRYTNKLEFNNGYSNINVKGCKETLLIDRRNNVIVNNENNDKIILPKEYHWGTNFTNGISLVRRFKYGCEVIGVIKEDGNIVLEADYDFVTLLENKMLLVKKRDCYGLFTIEGKCILPTIFTDVEFVSEERIRVVWNLNFSEDWCGSDKPYTVSKDKYNIEHCSNFLAKQRSAICNLKGQILNDYSLAIVCKFTNGYARTYKSIELETGFLNSSKVKYKWSGVVDIDGNTILPNDYDEIILYDHQYARIRKGKTIGIANLIDKNIKLFDDLIINHAWEVDSLGRMVYTSDGSYSELYDKWNGNRGVVSINGVIVEPGLYDSINLLPNGLIEVTRSNYTLFGMLDTIGREIIPPKYTYITYFDDDKAVICFGGQITDKWPIRITGGKWGIINSKGEFIQECTLDEMPEIKKQNSTNVNNDASIVKRLIKDYIPKTPYHYSSDCYYEDDNDYDNGYSKYGGYNGYDDETIDETFGGDPSLTWNID